MVGTGRLAPELVAAHAAVRPIREVTIWGRNQPKAEALAGQLRDELGLNVTATAELELAVRAADLVSCGTTSALPLVHGAWLAEAHLDLVGGFTPAMREADDEAVRRARVWVDTADGGTREAGDIVQPLASGVLAREAIVGDLFGLCRGDVTGRATAGRSPSSSRWDGARGPGGRHPGRAATAVDEDAPGRVAGVASAPHIPPRSRGWG